jgi:hypothetical protein
MSFSSKNNLHSLFRRSEANAIQLEMPFSSMSLPLLFCNVAVDGRA